MNQAICQNSKIAGAGAILSPACCEQMTYDASSARPITPAAFFAAAEPGKVYCVAGDAPALLPACDGDGRGAILLAPAGLLLQGAEDVALKNLTLIGPLFVENCKNLVLSNVQIISDDTALTLDAASADVRLCACYLTGVIAVQTAADRTVVLDSHLSFTSCGVADTAKEGTLVQNCVLSGRGTALRTSAAEAIFRNLTVRVEAEGCGICLSGATNTLLALNVVEGAERSLIINGSDNVSVLLSSFASVEARDNCHLYICDNALSGRLVVHNNNYFIADGNCTPQDGADHSTVQSGNINHNGDSLMDVTARPAIGADEALLPHEDKEQFFTMPRKAYVRDVADETPLVIDAYIAAHIKTDDYVIIAPGAYENETEIVLGEEASHKTIYAYGVYMERQADMKTPFLRLVGADGFAIKGLAVGHVAPQSVHVHVLEKREGNRVLTVTGAGIPDSFGEEGYEHGSYVGAQRAGAGYPYRDIYSPAKNVVMVEKTVTCGLPGKVFELCEDAYGTLRVGDVLTGRDTKGGVAFRITACSDTRFSDMTIYGRASVFTFIEERNLTAVHYNRVKITTKAPAIIDQATYEAYRQLEQTYGVCLEVSVDAQGRYRGAQTRISSRDATHGIANAQGSHATCCVFENMCDDATNQRHTPSRLHDVVDNGDGTTTVYYKGLLSVMRASAKLYQPCNMCHDFRKGDRVFIYTAKGQLLCDTPALADAVVEPSFTTTVHGTEQSVPLRSVRIATGTIRLEPLADFDLSVNTEEDDKKVMVDNMSMASNYFSFDNCKFQNIRSRGLLIKASGGTIKNVTFRNLGMAGAAILYEIYWGESGVSENLKVERNLFDNTGVFGNWYLFSPVAVVGLGSQVDEDYLLYKNIRVADNQFINRRTDHAVYINSAKGVQILQNDFGPFCGNDFGCKPEPGESKEAPKPAIQIFAAMDVEITGNRFADPARGGHTYITAEKNRLVHGLDVEQDGFSLVPDAGE